MTDDQMQRTDIPQDKNRTMREAFTMTDYKNNARNHLKVNLHLTETCNYRCRYCFAHFENGSDLPLERWKQIVDNLKESGLVRAINFAGGEPVLYPGFVPLFQYCFDQGFLLSIITNGSFLRREALFPRSFFSMLDVLGISVDSFSPETLRRLGCCTPSGEILSRQAFLATIRLALSENPRLKIKVNTVVSAFNVTESLAGLAQEAGLARWKFLKVKPFVTHGGCGNQDLLISDRQFQDFCKRNEPSNGCGVAEAEMRNTYILIDNHGNLLDSSAPSYTVVGNLLEEPFEDVFRRYQLNVEEYEKRYDHIA